MKTKEKKNKNALLFLTLVILFTVSIIYFVCAELFKENSYAATASEPVYYPIAKQENIDLDAILQDNTKITQKEEIIKQEIDLEYTTSYQNNPELPKGMLQVIQDGTDGKQEVIIKKYYENENFIKEETIGSQVTKSSVNKIVEIGTGAYQSNYQAKVGDTLYVTSTLLAVRVEPNENANKLITLMKNSAVKLLNKKAEWYQIQYQTYIGWTKAECLTYRNPNENNNQEEEQIPNGSGKTDLLNKLSFDMKLNKPSGLTIEQFQKIFRNDARDKNKVFSENAQYFYYAEKQYQINGVFLAAVAIHESGWGTSAISLQKKNLFGYGAYDSTPYSSAYSFNNYAEGIDLLARVFTKYYINPKGTKIYDGNKADGCYYNGATLTGVNKKYATDKKWSNGVYSWMKYLYNKI